MKQHFVFIITLCIIFLSLSKVGNTGDSELLRIKNNECYGYIDTTGKIVVEPSYNSAPGLFSEGLATVPNKEHTKIGYINTKGDITIPHQFVDAYKFSEGFAGVRIGNKYGFIDKTGKIVIQPEFVSVCNFSEGLACVRVCLSPEVGCPYGFINKKGEMVIKPFTFRHSYFFEGLACVLINEQFGYIDKTGKIVIEPQFDCSAANFSEGLARVKIDGKYGYVDKKGAIVIQPKYLEAGSFSECMAFVQIENGKYGFIDKQGKMVISPQYDIITAGTKFSDERACVGISVEDGELYGYIDKAGKIVIPPSFYWCWNFNNGIAKVDMMGEIGYIDTCGNYIWNPRYSSKGIFLKTILKFLDFIKIIDI